LIGGITIKRVLLILLAALIFLAASSCRSKNVETGAYDDSPAQGSVQKEITQQDNDRENTTENEPGENTPVDSDGGDAAGGDTTGSNNAGGASEQLLQSASVDLDADGTNEIIEVVAITPDVPGTDGYQSITGHIKIIDGDQVKRIPFWEKSDGSTGLISGMQFEDLDGDGAKDIFITIPDSGAAFSYSNCFIYSYKKDLGHALTSDRSLAEFIAGFGFRNAGNQVLTISNSRYGFSADLHIELDVAHDQVDDYMNDYERQAWIEPVSIDISEDAKISLSKDEKGRPQIKVPLPIFGLATVNMIGEIDLYYTVDDTFRPVLRRFEVIDFDGMERIKAGSCSID